jgi:hypothetical protein
MNVPNKYRMTVPEFLITQTGGTGRLIYKSILYNGIGIDNHYGTGRTGETVTG